MKNKGNLPQYYLLNDLLIQWNPLSVEGVALHEEYIGLIPRLIELGNNKQEIKSYLLNILIKEYGVDFNPTNKIHNDDLEKLVCEIYEILN